MPTLVDVLRYSAVRYSVVCPYTSLTADNSEIAMHNPSAITDGAMARYGNGKGLMRTASFSNEPTAVDGIDKLVSRRVRAIFQESAGVILAQHPMSNRRRASREDASDNTLYVSTAQTRLTAFGHRALKQHVMVCACAVNLRRRGPIGCREGTHIR